MTDDTKVRDHQFSPSKPRTDGAEAFLSETPHPYLSSLPDDWTWETDERLEITFVSERFSQTCALRENVILGRTLPALTLADDKAGLGEGRTFNLLEHLKPFKNVVCTLPSPRGEAVHITLSGAPRFSARGTFLGYSGTACNITPYLAFQRRYHEGNHGHARPSKRPAVTPRTARAPYQAPPKTPPSRGGETTLFSDAPDAFVVYGADGRILAVSPQYAALYPAVRDLIKPGASLGDILHATARRLPVAPFGEDPECWVARKLEERLHPQQREQEIFRDGKWWRITELLSTDGNVISMHTDITARRKAAHRERQSEARYRRLIDLIPDMICTVRDGAVTWLNPAGLRMLGLETVQDILGKPFVDMIHPDYRLVARDKFEHLSAARSGIPLKMKRADGSTFDAELSLSPYPDDARNGDAPLDETMIVVRDITVHNHTAWKLLDREARLRGIMNAVVDGIVSMDEDGIILSLNAAGEALFGYAEREIVGCAISKLIDEKPTNAVRKAKETGDEAVLSICDPDAIGQPREFSAVRKDASRFPLELTVSRLARNGTTLFIAVARDLSARKSAQKALRDSEERYALAIDGAAEGIWDWNIAEDTVYTSDVLRDMLAYKTNRIKSRSWMRTIHPADRKRFRRTLIRHLKGESDIFSIEYRLNSKNTGMRWVRQRGKALRDETGRAYRIAGSLSDVTERIAFQRSLKKAKETAEIANRVKSEFLANMSHELRTPLNAIIGFSDIMRSELFGEIDPRYKEYSQNIHSSGSHLLGLINDILDVSRIEVGQLELNDDIIAPLDALEYALAQTRPCAETAGVTLNARIDEDLPLVRVDGQRFKQIVLNLLSNAVKFTGAGGSVTLGASVGRAGRFEVTVTDTGIGMSAKDIELSMTPFGQVDGTLSRKHEGTGLGLPLAKSFVEMHGGRLCIRSAPGKGTHITATFPSERTILPEKL